MQIHAASKLGVAVVGCGYWGPNLARNFAGHAACRLAWLCDTSPRRLEHLSRIHSGVSLATNIEQVLADPAVDAVVVATPVRFHHALARASLAAGKHTFIEKPMAATSAECVELRDLAAARQLRLMVGHTYLYAAAVRRIKEIIDSGEIGDIRYISSRRLNLGLFQNDINVVWDLAPHDLSIIMHLIGKAPAAVNCQGQASVHPGIEDVANLTLTFEGGGFAMVHSSWLDPNKVRQMTIVGTKKMITYDDVEPLHKIRIYDQHVTKPPYYDTFADFHYSYHYGDVHVPYVRQEEPLKIECDHFIESIRRGTPPLTDGEAGLCLVRILEAASESLRRGGARVALSGA